MGRMKDKHWDEIVDNNPTIRKYPRTLNEAFPFGVEYGAAIERTERFWTPVRVALALTYAVALIVLGWVL